MSEQDQLTVSTPGVLSKRFFPLSQADLIVLSIIVIATIVTVSLDGTLWLFVGVVLVVILLWSLNWGKTYDRAVMQVYDIVTHFVYEDCFWRNVDQLKLEDTYIRPVWWRRFLQSLLRRRHPYPLRVDWLDDVRFGEIGIGYNIHEQTDSVVFLSDGSDVSRKDPATRLAMVTAFGDSIKRLSIGTPVTVTLIIRPRRVNPSSFDIAIDRSHHPEAVVPAASVLMSQTGLSAEQLYEEGKITKRELRWVRLNAVAIADPQNEHLANGKEVNYALVITIPRDTKASKAAKAAARKKGKLLSNKEVRRLPLTRTLKIAHSALLNLGAEGLRILNRDELEKFYDNQADNQSEVVVGNVPPHHPKRGIYGYRHSVEIDGMTYVTYRVKAMDRLLDFSAITRLYTHTSPKVTLATTGESTAGKSEGISLYWVKQLSEALTEDVKLGESVKRDLASIGQRSKDIADTRGMQYMNILLVVQGNDDDKVAEDCDLLTREAGALGFLLEEVPGSSLQLRAMLAATTGAVRL